MHTIAVLGAGSWGTALAVHLARLGHDVRLWGRDAALVARLAETRVNADYLPGVALVEGVHPTTSIEDAVGAATLVVVAVPSQGLRAVVHRAVAVAPAAVPFVSAAKGLEHGTLFRMSQVIADEAGPSRPVAVLSGPTFAAEVAAGLPTAVVVASTSAEAARLVQQEFRGPSLRLYATDDVAGVEIGGALKNVVAIAAGVVESLGLGHNAMAALITRGLVEISRLATAMGGRPDTLAGLSGLGDLVLTCTGHRSRNRQVGVELGRGRSLEDILRGQRMVAEGVRTAQAALDLGARHGVELPITAADAGGDRRRPHAQGGARRADAAAAEERSRQPDGADMRRIGTILAERRLAEQVQRQGRACLARRATTGHRTTRTGSARSASTGPASRASSSAMASTRCRRSRPRCDGIRVLLDESGLALGWKMGAGRDDIWHDETGFARSIPIVLGPALSRRLERLFDREIRRETQRLERRAKRKSTADASEARRKAR